MVRGTLVKYYRFQSSIWATLLMFIMFSFLDSWVLDLPRADQDYSGGAAVRNFGAYSAGTALW